MFEFLWKGLILGFVIAAPVGPIAILCIRKTIHFGKISGFCAGLGAATADTLYGFLSAFFLTFFSYYLLTWHIELKIMGGLFLLLLAWRTARSELPPLEERIDKIGLLKDFLGTFFLTLLNPLTLFAFIGILAGLGLVDQQGNLRAAILLVIGVFCGSAFWWIILSEGVARLRKKFNLKTLKRINQIAAGVIALFGIYSLLTALIKLC